MVDAPANYSGRDDEFSGYQRLVSDGSSIRNFQSSLEEGVFGQSSACEVLARAVIRARIGLSDKNRPKGVFFFLGPTGVGKTELTKILAQVLYKDDWRNHYVYIDGTSLTTSHSISRLEGADPNYMGYGDPTLLDPVRTQKDSIICFDEVEKAHRRIHRFFLPIIEEGKTTIWTPYETDGTRRGARNAKPTVVDFSDSILIFTSNIGSEEIEKVRHGSRSLGFQNTSSEDHVQDAGFRALKEYFSDIPEFLNRFSSGNIICFEELGPDTFASLLNKFITVFNAEQIERGGYRLIVEPEVRSHLLENIYTNPKIGARGLRALFEDRVLSDLAERIEASNVPLGSELKAVMEDSGISFLLKEPSATENNSSKTQAEESPQVEPPEMPQLIKDFNSLRGTVTKKERKAATSRQQRLIGQIDRFCASTNNPTTQQIVEIIERFYREI